MMHVYMLSSITDVINSALDFNLTQMLVQIIATLVLVLVVRFFFWNKITAFLTARQEFMAHEIDNAKVLNQEAKELKESALEERTEILVRSKEIIESAKTQGENEKSKIIQAAKEEATRLIQSKEEELEMEKERARADLRNEVIELAVVMAEKIIKKEVDGTNYTSMSLDDFESSEEV